MLDNVKIARVDYGVLAGRRPRAAGANARLGAHGDMIRVPILRLTAADGSSGFGFCVAHHDRITALLGRRLDEVFDTATGVGADWLPLEYALWTSKRVGTGCPSTRCSPP